MNAARARGRRPDAKPPTTGCRPEEEFMSQVYAVTLTGLMLLALAAWADEKPASNPPTPGAAAEPFHPRLLEIAKNYTTYRRVDERLLTTEILCVAPGPL